VTAASFMAYLRDQTRKRHPASLETDPQVEMYDGKVRVFDGRGESCYLPPRPLVLRAIATQLELCADEIERRGFE
jgi:hypothetical protein